MRVLVTGANGFIGSHLSETLVLQGFEVRALCQYNSSSSWGWLDDSPCAEDMEIVIGDVRDQFQMQKLCRGVDTVYHLAALIAIPYSYMAPTSYIQTNVSGTLNVMQSALDANVRRVIHTSTSEVYGTALTIPINENHPLQAQSPYAASKIGADAIAYSFYRSFNLPLTIARPFNTYGPRQSARAVIPTVITQLLSGSKVLKLGALSPTRDFNFVRDICNGFILLAMCDEAVGKIVNIGSGTECSIEELVSSISRLMQIEILIECDEQRLRPSNSEVERLVCDNALIRALTGYTPDHNLENGLKLTIDWLKRPEILKQYKSHRFNV